MSDWDLEVRRYLEAHPQRSFKLKDLQRALRVPSVRYRQFRDHVLAMARAGHVALLPRRRVQALAGARLLEGTVGGVAGLPTHVVLAQDERLPLDDRDRADVAVGDRVRVRRVRSAGTRRARVVRVVLAGPRTVFGTLQRFSARWVLIPDGRVPGISGGLFVDDSQAVPDDAEGSLARASVAAFDPTTTRPLATELTLLGPADHPRPAIARLVGRFGWPVEFAPSARAESHDVADPAGSRVDLQELQVFTIDPIDAKDHDDAVSLTRGSDESYDLGVHIADVASYVPLGGALDAEAHARATSVYPPGGVIPMLPDDLSSGECSLHHGVPRRTVSVILHYDRNGRRTGVELGLARVRSRASLAYEHAEELLQSASEPPADRIEGVDARQLATTMRAMLQLAELLREARRRHGSLFIERPERAFTFAEDGHVATVTWRPQLRSHWIIEEFMLEANRAVAEALHAAELPLLWRIHEPPDEMKVDELVGILDQLGVRWRPREPVGGEDYTRLMEAIRGHPLASLVSLLMLRSLMKARYHAGWERHFGLGFDEYTHFTSPIRRYPDLHNQRWLHRLIVRVGRGGWLADAPAAARLAARTPMADAGDRETARRLADHCSEQERRAMELERAAQDICAADALRAREGETLAGMIVSVVPSGVFVELAGAGLDGFVGVEQLARDWYTFDPKRHLLIGQRTGRSFRLGQRVRVLLEHVDVASGRVWLGGLLPPAEDA